MLGERGEYGEIAELLRRIENNGHKEEEGVLIEVVGPVITLSCGTVAISREMGGAGLAQEYAEALHEKLAGEYRRAGSEFMARFAADALAAQERRVML